MQGRGLRARSRVVRREWAGFMPAPTNYPRIDRRPPQARTFAVAPARDPLKYAPSLVQSYSPIVTAVRTVYNR